jgi:hypothetical protein
MSGGRAALVVALVVALVGAAAWWLRDGDDGFDERAVPVTALPALIREEVRAHGGGRCVEQHPSVYLCVLAAAKQAHEGRSGREWCFDSDGARTLGAYPASRHAGGWRCAPG